MKRLKSTMLFIIFLTIFIASTSAAEYIKIASFNILEFGEGNNPNVRHLDKIVEILHENEFDLIAIQEVGVLDQAEEQFEKMVEMLNDLIEDDGEKFGYLISPQSGDEKYGFLFRNPVKIKSNRHIWLDRLIDPSDVDPG